MKHALDIEILLIFKVALYFCMLLSIKKNSSLPFIVFIDSLVLYTIFILIKANDKVLKNDVLKRIVLVRYQKSGAVKQYLVAFWTHFSHKKS